MAKKVAPAKQPLRQLTVKGIHPSTLARFKRACDKAKVSMTQRVKELIHADVKV